MCEKGDPIFRNYEFTINEQQKEIRKLNKIIEELKK